MNISKQITKVAKLLYGDFLILKAFGRTVYLLKPSRVFTVSWTCPSKKVYKHNINGSYFSNPNNYDGGVLFKMRWESLWLVSVLIMTFVPIQ